MKAKEVLKILKIARPTLTKYVKNGKIKAKESTSGMYDYDEDSVFAMTCLCDKHACVIYACVSTQKQKKDLNNQIETIRKYVNKNGYNVDKVYSDIASGLNYDRGEFQIMLNEIIQYRI